MKNEIGVRGNLRLSELLEAHHKREGLKLLGMALRQGWIDGFWIDYQEAKQAARQLLKDDDARVRLGAVKVLSDMAVHDLKLLQALDDNPQAQEAPTVVVYNVPAPRQLEG